MEKTNAVLLLALVLLSAVFLAGCNQPSGQNNNLPNATQPPATNASPPANPPTTQTGTNATNITPAANATPPEPAFSPVHAAYRLSAPQGMGQGTLLDFNLYLDDKTECSGRPAVNGYVAITQPGTTNWESYQKVTLYLDTGEAVYSNSIGPGDLGFDTAKPALSELDIAFSLQTIMALGGKSLLSDDVWDAKRPVIVSNVSAFGSTGNYSLARSGNCTAASHDGANFTLSAKTDTMDGQLGFCAIRLEDVNLSLVGSAAFLNFGSGPTPEWHLTALDRTSPPITYYPQCLAPVTCPQIARPTNAESQACTSRNASMAQERDEYNCVTAYRCITYEDEVRGAFASHQAPGCPTNETLVQQAIDCKSRQGNAEYQYGQNGCINNVGCQNQ